MKQFKCILCGSKRYKFFLKNGIDFEYNVKGKFTLIKCVSCGLVSLFPPPSVKELLSFYPDSYHCYNPPLSGIVRSLGGLVIRQQASILKALIGVRGRILDVGCADGGHFDNLAKFGNWHFTGIDFNARVAKKGKLAGRDIHTATLEKFKYPKKSFDVIIMDHLLEHVVDPIKTLIVARRFLKKDGYLIGAGPNTNSFDRVFFGRYWGGYHLPRHVWHFNIKALRRMLKKSGFGSVKISCSPHTGHWALSFQNFFQSKKATRATLNYGRSWYYHYLLILLIPVAFISSLFQKNGVITFIAQKEKD